MKKIIKIVTIFLCAWLLQDVAKKTKLISEKR